MRNVLISGAGMTGPALAYWLSRKGFSVTVVERSPSLRGSGHSIDIRGVALEVVDRMGLGEQIRAAKTETRGMTMVDGQGNELFRSEEYSFTSGQLDNEDVELLREDLIEIFHEATKDHIEYLFGESIVALRQDDHGVEVDFAHSATRKFDFVIGADGLHSSVRKLAFGPEQQFTRHLGHYAGIFPMANFMGLDNWQVWFRDSVSGAWGGVFPVRNNSELRAALVFKAEPLTYDYRDIEQQKQLTAERLEGVGWEVPTLLKAMAETPDFYFDVIAQIHMDSWSTGRVALAGDAAHCASLITGQGTSLAVVGAYILADELGRPGVDHSVAFAAYERRMRPFVTLNQALADEGMNSPSGHAPQESLDRAKNAISLDADPGVG